MSIGFRHLEVFKAVMATGSVTEAAKSLHTSQPTVSRELARFEQLSGLALFKRERGKLNPTPAAQRLMDEITSAYEGLDRVNRTISSLRQFENGQITIASLPALAQSFLPQALKAFRDEEPEVQVVIETKDPADLNFETPMFDIGIMEVNSAPAGTNLAAEVITEQLCVLPPGHPLNKKRLVTLGELAGEDFIYLSSNDPYRQLQDTAFAEQKIVRKVGIETVSSATACSMVKQGLGVSIVNPFTALDFASQGCVVKRLVGPFPFKLCMVQPNNRVLNPTTSRMMQLLNQTSVKLLQQIEAL